MQTLMLKFKSSSVISNRIIDIHCTHETLLLHNSFANVNKQLHELSSLLTLTDAYLWVAATVREPVVEPSNNNAELAACTIWTISRPPAVLYVNWTSIYNVKVLQVLHINYGRPPASWPTAIIIYCWCFYPLTLFFSSPNLRGLWADRHQALPHVRRWL